MYKRREKRRDERLYFDLHKMHHILIRDRNAIGDAKTDRKYNRELFLSLSNIIEDIKDFKQLVRENRGI